MRCREPQRHLGKPDRGQMGPARRTAQGRPDGESQAFRRPEPRLGAEVGIVSTTSLLTELHRCCFPNR